MTNKVLIQKNLDPDKIKIEQKSYKNIFLCYIGHVSVRDFSYATTNSLKLLCLFVYKINGYNEESSGNKYLTLLPTDESKDILKSMRNHEIKSVVLLDE